MQITHYLKKLYGWLIPYTCVLCHHPSRRAQDLCEPCHREFSILPYNCPRCARELSIDLVCGACLKQPPPFTVTYALFAYQDNIKRMILNLKFNEALVNARILGELLAHYLLLQRIALPDIIIPVPLHPKRMRERGFNQALEIARPVAKRLSLPIVSTACRRIKHTIAQATLPAEQRRQNIKNAFMVEGDYSNCHIALLDDVVTTGQTVTEIATTFKKAGAARVDIWCVARAL